MILKGNEVGSSPQRSISMSEICLRSTYSGQANSYAQDFQGIIALVFSSNNKFLVVAKGTYNRIRDTFSPPLTVQINNQSAFSFGNYSKILCTWWITLSISNSTRICLTQPNAHVPTSVLWPFSRDMRVWCKPSPIGCLGLGGCADC